MEMLHSLMKIGVVGTALAPEKPETGAAPLDSLLGDIGETSPERRLLMAAGTLAVYAVAGTESFFVEELPPGADADADADDWPAPTQRLAMFLGRLLEGDLRTLLPAALLLMKEKQVRLPEILLPDFLNLRDEQRLVVRPVLGRRGLWLAAQNGDWSWALEQDSVAAHFAAGEADDLARLKQTWLEGDTVERRAVLRRVRMWAPETASAWLAESWKKDKADQRAVFLELLRDGLGAADIPFLESIAKDRSQKIRCTRFRLLAMLAGSSVAEQLREQTSFLQLLEPISQAGTGDVSKKTVGASAKKLRMQVLVPEEADVFWQDSGISVNAPQGIGPKAWRLRQMLALIPLDVWQERLGASPEELIQAAEETEWSLSILEGWARSAISLPSSGWLPALCTWWRDFTTDGSETVSRDRQLRLELLPDLVAADPLQRTALVELLLNNGPDPALPWGAILKSLESPWPVAVARIWLQALRGMLKNHRDEYPHAWLATLPLAAGALPDECLAEALHWDLPEKQEGEGWIIAAWRKALTEFTERIEIRRVIGEEIHRLRG